MKIHNDRLHPRIVRVSRIVDVAFEKLDAVFPEALELLIIDAIERFFCELALERRRNLFAGVNHAARQRPFSRIGAFYCDELKSQLINKQAKNPKKQKKNAT